MSHASTSPRRPARARRAALVLAAVVALGACSHQRQVPESYGDTTRRNFTEGCEEALTQESGEGEVRSDDDAQAICECSYEAISNPDDGIPFEEFKEINEDLEDEPGPLPEAITSRVQACEAETASS